MEMNQIRYFLAVCEHRNFTHAASASNVSQPSLTTAVKKLEDELGGDLFVRDRAGCRLTALGKLVQPRLQKIYDETRQAKAEAVRHMRLERVPITVGVGETIGHSRISAAMERMRKRVPQELKVLQGGMAAMGGTTLGAVSDPVTALQTLVPETSASTTAMASGSLSLDARSKAKMQGYEGEACGECGNYTLVRNGTCMKCNTCGGTSGCS